MLLLLELNVDSELNDDRKIGASLLAPVGVPSVVGRLVEELPMGKAGNVDCCVDKLSVSTLPVVRGTDCVINSPVEELLVKRGVDTDG